MINANVLTIFASGDNLEFVKPQINTCNGVYDFVLDKVNGKESPYCFNVGSGIIRGNKDWKQCRQVIVSDIIKDEENKFHQDVAMFVSQVFQ